MKKKQRSITFEVKGHQYPKPRMTRRDQAKFVRIMGMRPCVQSYYNFVSSIQVAYLKTKSKQFSVVSMGLELFIAGSLNKRDISNIQKGIEDALIGYAYKNDTMQYLREYEYIKVVELCVDCKDKKICKSIKKCKKEKTVIAIREMII